MLRLRPITIRSAKAFVGKHHRHNRPPSGAIFAVSVVDEDDKVRGVAMVGRPVARKLQDGQTCEIIRCCTDGARNACTMLYGACLRIAKTMGYRRIFTYTLASEPGTSLKLAGFVRDKEVPAEATWNRNVRHRVQVDLFQQETRPSEAKVRWLVRFGSAKEAPCP